MGFILNQRMVVSVKTVTTAVVLIPPLETWEPIQAIRKAHDRNERRWMPHVSLLYPFLRESDFADILPALRDVALSFSPIQCAFEHFRFFAHRGGVNTLWLDPSPSEAIHALQEALWRVCPECGDTRMFPHGFTPHLTVGQVQGEKERDALVAVLQNGWEPVSCRFNAVSVIQRKNPPDDVFRVVDLCEFG
jgi:2'-5' RNA ligase